MGWITRRFPRSGAGGLVRRPGSIDDHNALRLQGKRDPGRFGGRTGPDARMNPLSCFKAYDVRGRVGVDFDAPVARRIAQAFATELGAGRVVVGRDTRTSSGELADAVRDGLRRAGAEVCDLGLCGTEEVYFATDHFGADGGVMVTASHNPAEWNGLKMVRGGAAPLEAATFVAIRARAEEGRFTDGRRGDAMEAAGAREAYVARVLSFVDPGAFRPLTLLVDAGNGAAGPSFDAVAAELGARGAALRFHRINHAPDGTFPNGVPNPQLPGNRAATGAAVVASGADMGVAWDGDFDRCFFFDAAGRFVPGEYVVGLLAGAFLAREPGAVIVHDPRVIWNTRDLVGAAGGRAVQARTGHAFLKQALRETGAVYGGEMSAHHYFRDFMCCDSGMIPWLLVAELVSRSGTGLGELVAARRRAFPSSGEINFAAADPEAAIGRVREGLAGGVEDRMDGLSLSFADWRLNLRRSNTEGLLRLNIETRGEAAGLAEKVALVEGLIGRA